MTINFVAAVSESVPTTDTVLFTASTTINSAQIVSGVCNNYSAGAETITVNIISSGGSVGTTNEYISALSIAAGDNDPLEGIVGAILAPGDSVSIVGSTVTTMNLRLGIKELS